MTAPLPTKMDHVLLRVLGTELRLLAAGVSIRRLRRATRVTAPLAHDICHSCLGVPGAELRFLAVGFAIRWAPCTAMFLAAWLATRCDCCTRKLLKSTIPHEIERKAR